METKRVPAAHNLSWSPQHSFAIRGDQQQLARQHSLGVSRTSTRAAATAAAAAAAA
eukprot:CAMPEP_0172827524 /NCGR_PEP_ID=MMETSP1075-20121228/20167_1 /TAXON_ID=2916 /ORGANISM="Ceratium fusus, Strain PA161109" /LENGTH=55 /DNA_ID=CAMNT_0013669347 /DNA_START=86 /DNA_END=249 /DNA_ORIENTATION=+